MTCPYCGAYSPKNTATCNRCGRRLPLEQLNIDKERDETTSSLPEYSGYGYGYRQPPQTKFGEFLEMVGTFLDDIMEDPFAKKVAIGIILFPIALYIILRCCGVCSGCFQCGVQCGAEETPPVSVTDVIPEAPPSGSDISGSDALQSDVSQSDVSQQQ